ncbi:hypothetical protein J6590_001227 [Homalodisca vitripennis]|nr:hypothetical protein J6590_001227 [Homalodisca vitripennis]
MIACLFLVSIKNWCVVLGDELVLGSDAFVSPSPSSETRPISQNAEQMAEHLVLSDAFVSPSSSETRPISQNAEQMAEHLVLGSDAFVSPSPSSETRPISQNAEQMAEHVYHFPNTLCIFHRESNVIGQNIIIKNCRVVLGDELVLGSDAFVSPSPSSETRPISQNAEQMAEHSIQKKLTESVSTRRAAEGLSVLAWLPGKHGSCGGDGDQLKERVTTRRRRHTGSAIGCRNHLPMSVCRVLSSAELNDVYNHHRPSRR